MIWRYLDFTKLVSLFHTRSLFFSRADLHDDLFEGAFPDKDQAKGKWISELTATLPREALSSEADKPSRERSFLTSSNGFDGPSLSTAGTLASTSPPPCGNCT